MSTASQSHSPARTTTNVKKPRKSPLSAAVFAAEKAVTRTEKRKARSATRVTRLQARIAATLATAGQFDTLIEQLKKNVAALRQMESALVQA